MSSQLENAYSRFWKAKSHYRPRHPRRNISIEEIDYFQKYCEHRMDFHSSVFLYEDVPMETFISQSANKSTDIKLSIITIGVCEKCGCTLEEKNSILTKTNR